MFATIAQKVGNKCALRHVVCLENVKANIDNNIRTTDLHSVL